MEQDTHTQLKTLCDAYAAHMNLSHWRVSFLARGDGKSCTLKTAAVIFQWFSDHWPIDLEWPRSIPRPDKTKEAA